MSEILKGIDPEFDEEVSFIITKWTKNITDSGKDETVNKKPEELDAKFRLLDDDGNILAYGYSSDDSSFLPMDYYRGSYGCTEIQYKNEKTKEYETL